MFNYIRRDISQFWEQFIFGNLRYYPW